MLGLLVVVEAEVVVDEDEVVEVEEVEEELVPEELVEGDEPSVLVLVPVLVELDEVDGLWEDESGCSVRVIEVHVPLPGLKESRRALLGGQDKK